MLRSTDGANLRRIATLLLAIAQILVPMLPTFGYGQPIGSRSDAVQTLITPAGWAFGIWSLLYAGCLAYAIYQALPRFSRDPLVVRLGWLPAGAFLGNALWALYVQAEGIAWPSALIIAFALSCVLGAITVFARWEAGFSLPQHLVALAPLSALAGWLTAATIVNVASVLVYYGVWIPQPDVVSSAVLLAGSIVVAVALLRTRGNPWYAAAFLWALAGIIPETPDFAGFVQTTAIMCVALVLLAVLYALLFRHGRARYLETTGSEIQR